MADVKQIEKSINKNTSGIMIPNLLGNVPDWEKIYKIAKKYGLKVLRILQTQSVTHLKIKIQVNILTLLLIVFMLHI